MESNEIRGYLSEKGYFAISFRENIAGLLLINVKVNGQDGLFILDTGAGVSVVDSNMADRLQLQLQHDNVSYTGAGAGGQGLAVTPSTGNTIEIGEYRVNDFTLSVMSMEHVSQTLTEAGCEEFLGVIGVDILKPGKAIIDYGTMTLYLSSNGQPPGAE